VNNPSIANFGSVICHRTITIELSPIIIRRGPTNSTCASIAICCRLDCSMHSVKLVLPLVINHVITFGRLQLENESHFTVVFYCENWDSCNSFTLLLVAFDLLEASKIQCILYIIYIPIYFPFFLYFLPAQISIESWL
jgi:hypothetical protein